MGTSSQAQHLANELQVLHWNIHSWHDEAGGSNLDAVVELMNATSPHVASLVEVDESWGTPSVLNEIAQRCGYVSVFTPSFEFGEGDQAGGFGNALLTKLPILAVRQRQLVWPPRTYDGNEPSEPRSAVFAKLQTPTGPIWVGSTHLPRSDEEARKGTLRRLISFAESLDGPWLLCGDFNMPASTWTDMYPALTIRPESAEPTYPSWQPNEAIDYCVGSPGLMMEAKVSTARGSDHLPILLLARPANSVAR